VLFVSPSDFRRIERIQQQYTRFPLNSKQGLCYAENHGTIADGMPVTHRLSIENVKLDDEREIDAFDQQASISPMTTWSFCRLATEPSSIHAEWVLQLIARSGIAAVQRLRGGRFGFCVNACKVVPAGHSSQSFWVALAWQRFRIAPGSCATLPQLN